jgi:hypothetical protein
MCTTHLSHLQNLNPGFHQTPHATNTVSSCAPITNTHAAALVHTCTCARAACLIKLIKDFTLNSTNVHLIQHTNAMTVPAPYGGREQLMFTFEVAMGTGRGRPPPRGIEAGQGLVPPVCWALGRLMLRLP